MPARGRLIALEGIDGCGKSTQVRRVAAKLNALATHEPGGTPLGDALRTVVLDRHVTMSPLAELLVMAADRAQHVAEVLRPTLAAGRDVVCDRFNASTLAYQGYGRGLDLAVVRRVVDAAADGLEADLTILLDCPPQLALERRATRASDDRFESADAAFAERVRDGFLALAGESPRWRVVDASRARDAVDRDVDDAVATVLA